MKEHREGYRNGIKSQEIIELTRICEERNSRGYNTEYHRFGTYIIFVVSNESNVRIRFSCSTESKAVLRTMNDPTWYSNVSFAAAKEMLEMSIAEDAFVEIYDRHFGDM